MFTQLPNKNTRKGFTLIELLVVISTMVVVFSLGYANYRDFARRRIVDQHTESVMADLRLAQQYAFANRIYDTTPDNACEATNQHLQGYRFQRTGTTVYDIRMVCAAGVEVVKRTTLPAGVTIGLNPNTFLFRVLGRGTDLASDRTITISYQSFSRSITVTPSGNIYKN